MYVQYGRSRGGQWIVIEGRRERNVDIQVMKYFLGENDRVKLLVLFCGNEEDELLIKAALGTLAILSTLHVDVDAVEESDLEASERQRLKEMIDHQRIICEKMLNVSRAEEENTLIFCLGSIVSRDLQTPVRMPQS